MGDFCVEEGKWRIKREKEIEKMTEELSSSSSMAAAKDSFLINLEEEKPPNRSFVENH